MTILQRAASLAAVTLTLGLMAISSPVLANELDAPMIASTVIANNPLTPAVVPAAPAPATIQQTAPDGFDSLADAVAAQDAAASDEALQCLAGAIYFEAKGEPLAGQLAVANVIINRSKSGRFPSDICSVVTQRGQFSFVRGGEIPDIDTDRAGYRTAVAVAKVALASAWASPAPNALFFNAHGRRPARAMRVAAIGNHTFYR